MAEKVKLNLESIGEILVADTGSGAEASFFFENEFEDSEEQEEQTLAQEDES
jgi:hypothetical protein